LTESSEGVCLSNRSFVSQYLTKAGRSAMVCSLPNGTEGSDPVKVLLVSANRESFPDPVFPLGAAYAAAAVRKAGHRISVLDLAFVRDPEKTLSASILRENADLVAFSLRNLDNAAYPLTRFYLPYYRSLLRTARETVSRTSRSKAPLVVGGSAVGLMPAAVVKSLGADYGVAGESEESFPALLEALEGGCSPLGIPGVVVGEEGGGSGTPLLFPVLPVSPEVEGRDWTRMTPARDLFDLSRYVRVGGMANIQTKRGCAFRCRYCTYPLLEGRDHRLRDPDSVADEIEDLVERNGVRSFFFVDSVFNLPASHAEAISQALINRKIRIRWSAYASPAGLTRGLLETMAAAGCDGLEMGSDSADEATLETLGKGFSPDRILEVAEDCRKVGIPICHSLIFGGPGETPETVRHTCRRIDGTRPMAVVAMAGVRLYPGTPLGDWALSSGLMKSGDDFLEPFFFIEPGVRSFLIPYLESFSAARGNWILPGVVPPLAPTTQRVIRFLGYRKPLWHLLKYGVFKNRVYRDR